jgi:hypothetical protein
MLHGWQVIYGYGMSSQCLAYHRMDHLTIVRSLLELHIGCMCANAPAVKVFCRYYFRVSEGIYASGSRLRTATSSNQSVWGKISFWRKMTSHGNSGYLSGTHIAEQGVIVVQEQDGSDVEMGHVHAITKE